MRLAMELTLEGLVRTLRLKAHGLAEDVEAGYAEMPAARSAKRRQPAKRTMEEEDENDDRRRR